MCGDEMPAENRASSVQLRQSVDRWESMMRDVVKGWWNKSEDTFLPMVGHWKDKYSAWLMNKPLDRRRDEEPTESDENLKTIS